MSNARRATDPPVEDSAAVADVVASLADVVASHRQVQRTVRIPMRADLVDEISTLEARMMRERQIDLRENRDPVAPQLAAQIREMEDELAASEVAFTFRSIGRRPHAKLVADNPPTDEQKKEAVAGDYVLNYNPDAFPPALLAASCVTPTGSVEHWAAIWESWSDGQVSQLWQACMATQAGAADVGPKSLIASEILGGSAKS